MIGNRPDIEERTGRGATRLPLVYAGMLDALRNVGGEAYFAENGDILGAINEATAPGRLPGTHMDWLRLVAWGMVEGRDGTILQLTDAGLRQNQVGRSPTISI